MTVSSPKQQASLPKKQPSLSELQSSFTASLHYQTTGEEWPYYQ